MKNKHTWLFAVPILLVIILMAGCGLVGSGKTETREFNLADFSSIQVGGAFKFQIQRADTFKVEVTADDNAWNNLDISASSGTLHLGTKPGPFFYHTLQAVVTLPQLTIMDISGASNGDVSGFNSTAALLVTLSGASKVKFDNMTAGATKLDLSGASTASGSITMQAGTFTVTGASGVDLEGSGTDVSINSAGASHVTLAKFPVQSASVTLSGASKAIVDAKSLPSVDLSGASSLRYADSPNIGKIQTSGASTIGQQ